MSPRSRRKSKTGPQKPVDAEPGSYCRYCGNLFAPGDKKYHSHQAGMKGYYHWKCFIEACKEANRLGAQEIEMIAASLGSGEESPIEEGGEF